MEFTRQIEYNGHTYTVKVCNKRSSKKVWVDGEECEFAFWKFNRLKFCFVRKALLDGEEAMVVVYGRQVFIESWPTEDFKPYASWRFAPSPGSEFAFLILMIFGFAPFVGFAYYILEHIGALQSLVYLPILLVYLYSSVVVMYHPAIGRGWRFLIWLGWTVMVNLIGIGYGMMVM